MLSKKKLIWMQTDQYNYVRIAKAYFNKKYTGTRALYKISASVEKIPKFTKSINFVFLT